MTEIPDFSDHNDAQAWLETQPRGVPVGIAARSALRVVPALRGLRPSRSSEDPPEKSILTCLRATLVSEAQAVYASRGTDGWYRLTATETYYAASVAARSALSSADSYSAYSAAASARSAADSSAAIYSAVHSAARSAFSAATATESSAALYSAADPALYSFTDPAAFSDSNGVATLYSAAAAAAALSAAEADALALTTGAIRDVFTRPLWPESDTKDLFAKNWQSWKSQLAKNPDWDFWIRWYDGMWSGTPLNWELQTEVAMIPDEVWDKGLADVAEAIRKIEQADRFEIGPRLVLVADTPVFDIETESLIEQEALTFLHGRIKIALSAALTSSAGNGLREDSTETIEIRDGLASDNPSIVATTYYAACLSLKKKIGDVYPDDPSLDNLAHALWGASEEICEENPKAQARCARLAILARPAPISAQDRVDLPDVIPKILDFLKTRARQIIESDIERILSKDGGTKTVRARLTGWLTTISIGIDRMMKGDKRVKWLTDLVKRIWTWWRENDEPL